MRICRFTNSETSVAQFGMFDGDALLRSHAENIESVPHAPTDRAIAISAVKLLAPVTPSKIVCVGRNYREHAAEMGNKMPDEPLLFLKAPSAIIASGEQIELPSASQQVEHEGELGVVIGRLARKVPRNEDPLSYVFG